MLYRSSRFIDAFNWVSSEFKLLLPSINDLNEYKKALIKRPDVLKNIFLPQLYWLLISIFSIEPYVLKYHVRAFVQSSYSQCPKGRSGQGGSFGYRCVTCNILFLFHINLKVWISINIFTNSLISRKIKTEYMLCHYLITFITQRPIFFSWYNIHFSCIKKNWIISFLF